jgi:ribonuclease HI
MYLLQFDGLIRDMADSPQQQQRTSLMCYGWLIFKDGHLIAKGHGGVARSKDANSNIAEYLALIEGLDVLVDINLRGDSVVVVGDAKCVIDQMAARAEVNAAAVKPLFRHAQRLARQLKHVLWVWSPRENNHQADSLTRRALRQIRLDKESFQAALAASIYADRQPNKSNRFIPIMDLRVFCSDQIADLPA